MMAVVKAIPVERGCGRRQRGGIYSECGFGPFGRPIEAFIIDPPIPVDPSTLGIARIGTYLKEQAGVTHIFDWIGSSFYPNVADFVEEVRSFGMSRRLSPLLDFSRLTAESRHILLHSHGAIRNHGQYKMTEVDGAPACPREVAFSDPDNPAPEHPVKEMCARFWWQDVLPIGQPWPPDGERAFERTMPSFRYAAWVHAGKVVPVYSEAAIVLSVPVQRLVVIRDPVGGAHEKAFKRASKAAVVCEIEDE